MGRQSRRFLYRLSVGCGAGAVGTLLWCRWSLRPGSAAPPLFEGCESFTPQPRAAHVAALRASASDGVAPFDVLVVGGGLTGLSAAVEARRRGLRVALVEAADFGAAGAAHAPTLLPGPLTFVQRAVRQREGGFLSRAVEALWEQAVWRNVLPPEWAALERTFIPALHAGEHAELAACAVVSSLLSLGCDRGAPRVCSVVGRGRTCAALPSLRRELDGQQPYGGVVSSDLRLEMPLVAVALARTAEALGVTLLNYAPVVALGFSDSARGDNDAAAGTTALSSASPSPLVEATVHDMATGSNDGGGGRVVRLRARAVLNCAGPWADEVRRLAPESAQSQAPSMIEGYRVNTFIVAPRDALRFDQKPQASATSSGGDSGAEATTTATFKIAGVSGLHVTSTRFSFSSMLVTPWRNDTVLLGPAQSTLEKVPPAATAANAAVLRSDSGFSMQRRHIVEGLLDGGVRVLPGHLLSCLHSVVPLMRPPFADDAPWLAAALVKGYHLVATGRGEGNNDGTDGEDSSERLPCVSVYGGSPTQARVVARAAVTRLLNDTGVFTPAEVASFSGSGKTGKLRLLVPPSLAPESDQTVDNGAAAEGQPGDDVRRLRRMARDAYVVSLADVVFRRTAVGYTSPAEATAALPALAAVLAEELGWSAARTRQEIDGCRRLIGEAAIVEGVT